MEDGALYLRDGDAFVGTILTQGGWDPNAQNGAAVLCLLGHCLEDVPTLAPMGLARMTVDLVRPVPLGRRLVVRPTVAREGKKLQVVVQEVTVDDVVHVRATVLRLRTDDLSDATELLPDTVGGDNGHTLPPPDQCDRRAWRGGEAPGFLRGIDLRAVPREGVWVKLAAPVVAGEPDRETARMCVAFDFAQLINADMASAMGVLTMINPDVTAHIVRPPVGEWIAVTGHTRFAPSVGRGMSAAQLHDDIGVFGVASTTQLIQRR